MAEFIFKCLTSPIVEIILSLAAAGLVYVYCLKIGEREVKGIDLCRLFLLGIVLVVAVTIIFGKYGTARNLSLPFLLPPLYTYVVLFNRKTKISFLKAFGTFVLACGYLYHIAVSITELCLGNLTFLVPAEEKTVLFYNLTLLLGSIMVLLLINAKRITSSQIRDIMDKENKTELFKVYLLLSCAIIVYFDLLILPMLRSEQSHFSQDMLNKMYLEVLLRMVTLLVCGYIILFIIGTNTRHLKNEELLKQSVKNEQEFRKNLDSGTLFSYEANVTKNKMVVGAESFSEKLWQGSDNYFSMIYNFAKYCVHPEDEAKLYSANTEKQFADRLKTMPSYFLSFRVSPKRLLSVVTLSEKVSSHLKEAQSEWVWLQLRCVLTRQENGDVHIFNSLTDIDARMRQEENLRESVYTDYLTRCRNRAYLEMKVEEFISAHGKNASGVLLNFDMDNFKAVNDSLGHPAGDMLLINTAEILKTLFRSEDIIARYGGDEFAVFMMNFSNMTALREKLTELNERMRQEIPVSDSESIKVSASIGVVCYPKNGRNFKELYRNADKALYGAKKAGRDTYVIYGESV